MRGCTASLGTGPLTARCSSSGTVQRYTDYTETNEWHRKYYCAGSLLPPRCLRDLPNMVLVASDKPHEPQQQHMYVPMPVIIEQYEIARGCTRQTAYQMLRRYRDSTGPRPVIDVSTRVARGLAKRST